MPSAKVKFTKEERDRIMALSVRQFKIGGSTRSGMFDENTKMLYMLDENGELTGECARYKGSLPVTPPSTPQETSAAEQKKPAQPEKKKTASGDAVEKKSTSKNKYLKYLLLVVALMAVFVMVSTVMNTLSTDTEEQPDTVLDEPIKETVSDLYGISEGAESVSVIQVVRNMLPGEVISSDDIQEITVSYAFYAQLSLSNSTLYKWESAEHLIGCYVKEYMPSGGLMSYDDVVSSYELAIGSNPWLENVEGSYIKIPLTEELKANTDLRFGSLIDLAVVSEDKKTTTIKNPDDDETEEIYESEGITHESSVGSNILVDTYTISDLVVCDVLASDGNSIFDAYVSYMGVPVGERYDFFTALFNDDPSLPDELTPAYILVHVSDVQLDIIGKLDKDSNYSVSLADGVGCTSTDERTFAAESKALAATISEVVSQLEETEVISDE